jgi:hypothetical protein
MIEDFPAFFFGKDYAKRMENFDKGVSEIENRNSELFKEKALSLHYMISILGKNTLKIEIEKDSLPPRIEKEILDLFKSLFPKT